MPDDPDDSVDPAKKPYKVKEFAKQANVSEATVYRLVREGKLPAVRFGGAIRLPRGPSDRLLRGE